MTTPLESLAEAMLVCRAFASGAEAAPEAILWCDPGAEFTSVMPALRARLPHLLTFRLVESAKWDESCVRTGAHPANPGSEVKGFRPCL